MSTRWVLTATLALLVATAGVAAAQGHGRGRDKRDRGAHPQGRADARPDRRVVSRGRARAAAREERRFDDRDRALAHNWYYHNRSALPPGLRDRDRLPPGIERRFARGYVIEPRYREVIYPAPAMLIRVFAPPPPGWRYVMFGGHFVLIDPGFRVMDVIRLDVNLGR
jgi:Ni/Co efflux regulator RcnB